MDGGRTAMRGERGLLERLRGGEVLVGDGAIGVRLGAYGHRPGECPERWSLDHPEALRAIHAGYIAAGADVVLTNTLGGSRVALGRYGLAGEVEAINRGLAELLAETIAASGRRAHLAGDVGPTGELLAPYGALGEREAVATFREQITALLAGGAEVVFIETMMDLGEAVAAVRAAREESDERVAEVDVQMNVREHGTPSSGRVRSLVRLGDSNHSASRLRIRRRGCGRSGGGYRSAAHSTTHDNAAGHHAAGSPVRLPGGQRACVVRHAPDYDGLRRIASNRTDATPAS